MYYRVVVATAAPHQMKVGMADVDAFGTGKVEDAKGDHIVPIARGWRGIVGEVLDDKWLCVLHDSDDLHLKAVGAYKDISGRVGVVQASAGGKGGGGRESGWSWMLAWGGWVSR